MSFVRLALRTIGTTSRTGLQRVIAARSFSQSIIFSQEQQQAENVNNEETEQEDTGPPVHPSSDRSKKIPVESSIKYLDSDAYKETYGGEPVWKHYRRNFKAQFAPRKTRKTCIRQNFIATSNPCPICRDEYLVLDHRNISLLQQFISPYNGEVISYSKTGLCQRQHQNLEIAILRAKDYGTISFDVPFREYNYADWYDPEGESKDLPTKDEQ